ncbi:hypothetical protein Hdeb2414_s0010g00342091 [Helianthus debilis subsp. tardiflorus]
MDYKFVMEVCMFKLAVKNATSIPDDKDLIKLEAGAKISDPENVPTSWIGFLSSKYAITHGTRTHPELTTCRECCGLVSSSALANERKFQHSKRLEICRYLVHVNYQEKKVNWFVLNISTISHRFPITPILKWQE